MARSPFYPPASRTAQWFADDYPGDSWGDADLEKCVWHTTETTGWPGYGGGKSAPTFTVRMVDGRLQWRQHFPVTMSARALQNDAGGVQTNRDRLVQVEQIGTCDPVAVARWERAGMRRDRDFLVSWDLPAVAVEGFGHFAAWLAGQWRVPLLAVPTWKPYPSSYGDRNGVRLAGATFDSFRGHLGHQHVPENDHGDPGPWPAAAVMAAARRILNPAPPPREDDEMQDADRKWIEERLDAQSAWVADNVRQVIGARVTAVGADVAAVGARVAAVDAELDQARTLAQQSGSRAEAAVAQLTARLEQAGVLPPLATPPPGR